jgi:hypothetical protein
MFYENDDPVSIYSLASNAWEIIDALCQREGVDSLSGETRAHIPGGKKLRKDYINQPYRNFMKHADRDPDSILEGFGDINCDPILMLAVEDYMRLAGQSPVEFQVYQLWYLAVNPLKVAESHIDRVMEGVDRLFPGIGNVSRYQQKIMGREALARAKEDSDITSDSRTEAARRT